MMLPSKNERISISFPDLIITIVRSLNALVARDVYPSSAMWVAAESAERTRVDGNYALSPRFVEHHKL